MGHARSRFFVSLLTECRPPPPYLPVVEGIPSPPANENGRVLFRVTNRRGVCPTELRTDELKGIKGPGPLLPGLSASLPFSDSGRKVLPRLAPVLSPVAHAVGQRGRHPLIALRSELLFEELI